MNTCKLKYNNFFNQQIKTTILLAALELNQDFIPSNFLTIFKKTYMHVCPPVNITEIKVHLKKI